MIHVENTPIPWMIVDGSAALLVAAPAVPLALAIACIFQRVRLRIFGWLWAAPLPALLAALLGGVAGSEGAAIRFDAARLELTLLLDAPRAILLGVTSLLWCFAGVAVRMSMRDDPNVGRFAVAWLLALAGCVGVFVAADLASFYIFFALVSLAAFAMVIHDGTPRARRAAAIYLTLAVIGEAFLLLAFVLLAYQSPGESLRISTVVSALPDGRLADETVAFLLIGFGVKIGLFPLHGWLPLAHPAAPIPASAVLSGAVIKTGVIGLIAFLPFGAEVVGWSDVLQAAGWMTAIYGALMGLTQENPKTVLAYSSVSQMGIVAAILGAGLALGSDLGVAHLAGDGQRLATFHAAHHALAKGALFLGIGAAAAVTLRSRPMVLAGMAILALSLGGLPFTGGFLSKLATKPLFGVAGVGLAALASTVLSTAVMTHFLRTLFLRVATPSTGSTSARGLWLPFALTAIAAIVVPWMLVAFVLEAPLSSATSVGAVWSALWPMLIGVALAAIVPFGRLPVPEGDLICVAERWANAAGGVGALCERIDRRLRLWPVACAAMLITLAALIGIALQGAD